MVLSLQEQLGMQTESRRRLLVRLFPFIAFLFPLLTYLFTLNPKLAFIDAGELITVCTTLGIAHPTGYPLFTIMGRIFSLFPIGSVAFRINIISSIFSSFASLFLFLYFYKITARPFVSLSASLLFAFSRIVWHQSTSAEVYSITFCFVALLLFIHSCGAKNKLLFIAFTSGLALTNHMITITFIIPFLIYLVVTREVKSVKSILLFAVFFLLGASLYLYLPIRASLHPIMSWGKTVNLERFIWHITGKQYRVWMFSGDIKEVLSNLLKFLKLLSQQYTIFLIPIGLLGVVYAFREERKWTIFLLVLFVVNVFYGVNYSIPDIEPYFIISIVAYTIFIFYGLVFLVNWKNILRYFLPVVLIAVLFLNFCNCNEKGAFFANDMCMNLFSSVEPGGIVITNNWDYYSPSLYVRYIEGVRKDIVMVDKELLRRIWYFDFLEKEYPWLIENSKEEVDAYCELLDDFEHSHLSSPAEIQRRYIEMINSFIDKNIGERPCYITFVDSHDKDAKSIAPNYLKIPRGIVYEILKEADTTYFDYSKFIIRGVFSKWPYKDERTLHNLGAYPELSMKRGIYLLKMGRYNTAIKTFEFAGRWKGTRSTSVAYEAIAYLFLNQYNKSLYYFQKSLEEKSDDKMLILSIQMLQSEKYAQLKQEFRRLLGMK